MLAHQVRAGARHLTRPNEKIRRFKSQKREERKPGVAHFYSGKVDQFFSVANIAERSTISLEFWVNGQGRGPASP
jgi:hypothetical protein